MFDYFYTTDKGQNYLVQCQIGYRLILTKGKFGNGYDGSQDFFSLSDLMNSLGEMEISAQRVEGNTVTTTVQFTNRVNNKILDEFIMNEIGLFGKLVDEENNEVPGFGEALIFYSCSDNGDIIPGVLTEFIINFPATLSNASSVGCQINKSLVYPTKEEFEKYKTENDDKVDSHINNVDNPHGVTKEQVELGNVPNVTTNNQTPTFTQASTRTNIVSGETLTTILGKIKKFFADLKTVAFTGSYADLTDTPVDATSSTSGLMSAADKAKLDGVASGANNYTLPTASSTTLGGVKLSDSVTSTNSTSSGTAATPYAVNSAYKKAIAAISGTIVSPKPIDDMDYAMESGWYVSALTSDSSLYSLIGETYTDFKFQVIKIEDNAGMNPDITQYAYFGDSVYYRNIYGEEESFVGVSWRLLDDIVRTALNLKSNKWVAKTAGSGSAYTVTLDPAPTALEVGMTITIIPHTTSTTVDATLDVNGLGAKHICQRGYTSRSTYSPYTASFLATNRPVTLIYDGAYWVDTTYTKPYWYDIQSIPSDFTPSSHASSETTYGVGSGTNYGHLKLSSATDSTADVDGGTAATPAAAKAAYDKAVEVSNTRIWNSSGVTAANANSWALSSYKLTMSGARNIALAYGYSYDTLVEMLGEGNLLAACGGVAEFNGGTSAIIGGYAHKLNGIRAVILGGYNNIAHAYNVVCGKSCKEPTATDYNSNSGDLFVVGNGTASTRSNGFRVAANGNCYAGVAFNGTGADYNEVREWSDGNVDSEDRCGYMVAFDGIKIRLAQPGDNLRKVGIISGNSCITGNNFADYWHGKYKRDIYGRYETEPVHNDAEYDEDGNLIKEEYDGYSYVLSEDYDPSLEDEYIPRLDRSEYDLMATHGEVVVRDDGTCEADGYCIPGQDGIATKDNEEIGFYVMERIDENHVRVFVR